MKTIIETADQKEVRIHNEMKARVPPKKKEHTEYMQDTLFMSIQQELINREWSVLQAFNFFDIDRDKYINNDDFYKTVYYKLGFEMEVQVILNLYNNL